MKSKNDLIKEFALANGVQIVSLVLANDGLNSPRLSIDMRDKVIDYLADLLAENDSFDRHDLYDIVRNGYEGLSEYSDIDLIENMSRMVDLNDVEADNTKLYLEAKAELAIEVMLGDNEYVNDGACINCGSKTDHTTCGEDE